MYQLEYFLKSFLLVAVVRIAMAEESTKNINAELVTQSAIDLSTQTTAQFPLGKKNTSTVVNLNTTLKSSIHPTKKLSLHSAANIIAQKTAKMKIENFTDKLQGKIVQTPNFNSNTGMSAKTGQENELNQFPIGREFKQDLQYSTQHPKHPVHSPTQHQPSPLLLPQELNEPIQISNFTSSLASLVYALNQLLFLIEKVDTSSPKLNLKIENLLPANISKIINDNSLISTPVPLLRSLLNTKTSDKRIENNADSSKNEYGHAKSGSTFKPVEMDSILGRSFHQSYVSLSDTAAKKHDRQEVGNKKNNIKNKYPKFNFDYNRPIKESSDQDEPLKLKRIYIPVVYIN